MQLQGGGGRDTIAAVRMFRNGVPRLTTMYSLEDAYVFVYFLERRGYVVMFMGRELRMVVLIYHQRDDFLYSGVSYEGRFSVQ